MLTVDQRLIRAAADVELFWGPVMVKGAYGPRGRAIGELWHGKGIPEGERPVGDEHQEPDRDRVAGTMTSASIPRRHRGSTSDGAEMRRRTTRW